VDEILGTVVRFLKGTATPAQLNQVLANLSKSDESRVKLQFMVNSDFASEADLKLLQRNEGVSSGFAVGGLSLYNCMYYPYGACDILPSIAGMYLFTGPWKGEGVGCSNRNLPFVVKVTRKSSRVFRWWEGEDCLFSEEERANGTLGTNDVRAQLKLGQHEFARFINESVDDLLYDFSGEIGRLKNNFASGCGKQDEYLFGSKTKGDQLRIEFGEKNVTLAKRLVTLGYWKEKQVLRDLDTGYFFTFERAINDDVEIVTYINLFEEEEEEDGDDMGEF